MSATSKNARDQRLDELSSAVSLWATRRREALSNQISLCKRLLNGRLGASRVSGSLNHTADNLLVDEIDEFLTG
jgi:hypothetical protein